MDRTALAHYLRDMHARSAHAARMATTKTVQRQEYILRWLDLYSDALHAARERLGRPLTPDEKSPSRPPRTRRP